MVLPATDDNDLAGLYIFNAPLRIPIESDHLFRSNPIADSGVSDHLAGVGVS
jgi:hypothetical protein